MGSNRYGSLPNEAPHYVYLDAYWIDETEVTNAMFAEFINAKSSRDYMELGWFHPDYTNIVRAENQWKPKDGYEEHPVESVGWYGAQAYCEWAGRRLPTEAEWEKAARGEEGYSYPWGNEFDCSKGNFYDYIDSYGLVIYGGPGCDGYEETAPVGSIEGDISPYGVKDMAGNISEWVSD